MRLAAIMLGLLWVIAGGYIPFADLTFRLVLFLAPDLGRIAFEIAVRLSAGLMVLFLVLRMDRPAVIFIVLTFILTLLTGLVLGVCGLLALQRDKEATEIGAIREALREAREYLGCGDPDS